MTGFIVTHQCDARKDAFVTLVPLHERVDDHKQKASSIYKYFLNEHIVTVPSCLLKQFRVFAQFNNKSDCLIRDRKARLWKNYRIMELYLLISHLNLS